MVLILFALIGFFLGYRYKMTPTAYVIMASVTMTFILVQVIYFYITKDKSEITILPILINFIFVLFMFIGSLSHMIADSKPKVQSLDNKYWHRSGPGLAFVVG